MAQNRRLIDADALKTSVALYVDENAYLNDTPLDALKMIANWIDDAPAVEAEPVRHGCWIVRGGKRYCSVCRERACVTRDTDDFWYTVGTDYCPRCGAKMDLGV